MKKVLTYGTFDVIRFVMCDYWKGKFDFLKYCRETIHLPGTIYVSSSQIKDNLTKKIVSKISAILIYPFLFCANEGENL